MTPLDLITRRRHLEEELALAAATHQYVLDGSAPTRPDDRDDHDALLDRLRTRWTVTLDSPEETHRPRPRRRPRMAKPRQEERARHAAGRFAGPTRQAGAARTPAPGAAETALQATVERAERALFDDEGCYSVSRTHDAALDLAHAARALLNELETRHTE